MPNPLVKSLREFVRDTLLERIARGDLPPGQRVVEATLVKEFSISACRIIREELDRSNARVIFWLEFELHGQSQRFAELAWFVGDGDGWHYRCGQKFAADELPVPVDQLEFSHFDEVIDKVLY